MRPMAEVLRRLGSKHVLLVHSDGLDEIALDRDTTAVELKDAEITERSLHPRDFGLEQRDMTGLRATDVSSSLGRIRESLTAPASTAAALVRVNAAAAIYVSGVAADLMEASERAQAAIESGAAIERMNSFVHLTGKLRGTASE